MKAVLVDKEKWKDSPGLFLGQFCGKVVLEVEDSSELKSIKNMKFTQRVFDGKFGKLINYVEYKEIRDMIEQYPQNALDSDNLADFKRLNDITDIYNVLLGGL